MAALKEWVRGLVMLLILASILELLLPMGAMKKYIRMAMGLLIVLGVVRPVVGLLGEPVSFNPSLLVDDGKPIPSMNQIMVEARRFRAKNEALLLQEVQARLAEAARQAARQVEGVSDASATVQVTPTRSAAEYSVDRVSVTVRPGSRFGQVRPVEPVRISPGGQPESAAVIADAALADPVRQAVAQRLGITDLSLIQVLVERPDQSRR